MLREISKTAKEKFRKVVELTMEMDKTIMDLPVKPENTKKVIDLLYDEISGFSPIVINGDLDLVK